MSQAEAEAGGLAGSSGNWPDLNERKREILKEREMNSKEMITEIKANSNLEGIGIMEIARYNQVIVSGFSATPDWQVTRAELEALGFELSTGSGMWEGPIAPTPSIRERYEEMSEAEKAQADATFEKMARG